MNWYCYAIYGERAKPTYYVAEQEDVTEIETLRMQQRLCMAPNDAAALKFFSVLDEWKSARRKAR
jgi:hypothetical protein